MELTIYDKNGQAKFTAHDPEYHDIWMGEEYVTVSISSPEPLSLEIGDYFLYRGLTYTIYSVPSALKQARSGSYGGAFVYDNVKFSSRSAELADRRFFDIVLSDNEYHYTALSSFSFSCTSVSDLMDRIAANADRGLTGSEPVDDTWFFITPSLVRTRERYESNPTREARAVAIWHEYFGDETPDEVSSPLEDEVDCLITTDSISIFEAFSFIQKYFKLNFISRDRVCVVGGDGYPVANGSVFRYGKGNGLKTIERSADAEQQIITRLFAYGSDKNLPSNYYMTVSKNCFATITEVEMRNLHTWYLTLDMEWNSTLFTAREPNEPFWNVTIYNENLGGEVSCIVRQYVYSVQLIVDAVVTSDAFNIGDRIYFTQGVNNARWPAGHYETDYPNQLSVNTLMLPGFPDYSLDELCRCVYDPSTDETSFEFRSTPDDEYHSILTKPGNHQLTFSTDKLRPYIQSPNADTLGIKEGEIHFTEENDDNGLQEVYPSIEGMTVGDVEGTSDTTRLDELFQGYIIQDDGIFDTEGTTIDPFTIIIPNLGADFDLAQAYANGGKNMVISMKSGYCVGREFKVKNVTKDSNNRWVLTLDRTFDDSLRRYFPYSSSVAEGGTAIANEPYQVCASDRYVLTGIDIAETNYVRAASVKALRKAITWLVNNDYTRYTYVPKVDNIFMARQHDEAVATGGTSIHDTIKAGMVLRFADTDLNIDSTIYIDQLTIKEGGDNGIATYDITLRNDKEVGTLQRMQNQIDSITTYQSNNVRAEGARYFISKVANDVTAGRITFQQGLDAIGDAIFTGKIESSLFSPNEEDGTGWKIDANGNAELETLRVREILTLLNGVISSGNYEEGVRGWNIDQYGNADLESARIRSFLQVTELLINRIQAQEGDTLFSDNDQVEEVTTFDDGGVTHYILTLKEKWEGYRTAQMYGNVVKGIINTLAAKEAGVADHTTAAELEYQEQDNGGNYFFTSWMQVVATHNTAPSRLDENQIEVVLFGDNNTPAQKNFAPCPMMVIARWGCIDYSDPSSDDYQTVKESIVKRQRLFMISSNDGRVVKYTGVDSPILRNGNFGVTIGELPNFVKQYAKVAEALAIYGTHSDWLYAQGVVVERFIKIDRQGLPIPDVVFCGEWVDGSSVDTPTVRNGIYYYNGLNEETQQYETHEVRHNGGRWKCLQSQPIVSGGVTTYYEPKWNSPYWQLVDGNDNLSIEFVSSKGYSFRRGHVDTTITPHLFYGTVDITNDVAAEYWTWTRESESGKTTADETWDAQHTGLATGVKILRLTNNDMPDSWSTADKAIFTCSVTINDGNTTIIVQNQIIS